ncbi:MAG: 50S ribosomal protein L2 [Parcubacteria group bacterium GW2011_GWF2_39_13b]|nr:MAG: 50S ribosomal protein L2 [Parcubacteria group bacterium GW2011_GWF2_39_13b]
MTGIDYRFLTKKEPEKKLLKSFSKKAGRSHGEITVRHQGGGHKRKYRIIDFKREKNNVPAKVSAVEYDPNRTSFIALLNYADGEKRYIVAPEGLKVGDEIVSSEKTPLFPGNRLEMKHIPVGTFVHDIELQPGQGGKIARSAGNFATVMANEGGRTNIKMPSGEIRIVSGSCRATIGQVSNPEHNTIVIGKAGRNRWLGVRPTVRGSAMNPCDHPHGGGEGRAGIGLRRGPKTPWGKQARGVKTRRNKKWSNKFILQRRK